MKKVMSLLVVFALIFSFATVSVYAADEATVDSEAILVENGFSEDNIDALSETVKEELVQALEENPDAVDIKTTVLEIDNLAEVESFLSYTDQELIDMGADPDAVIAARRELEEESNKTEAQIAEAKNVSLAEAKYFKKAIDKGHSNYKNKSYKSKKSENPVTASGSISTTKLTYTQSVTNQSTSTQPKYKVNFAYTWKTVYDLAVFTDEIVAGWGGNLNTQSISSTSSYYDWGSSWGSFYKSQAMSKVETPNAGIEFKFPQALAYCNLWNNRPKTKTGSATFTLYQTKKQGYDTKVISVYCHRVISLSSASIGFSKSGPSIGLSIGGAWDQSPQKATTIGY